MDLLWNSVKHWVTYPNRVINTSDMRFSTLELSLEIRSQIYTKHLVMAEKNSIQTNRNILCPMYIITLVHMAMNQSRLEKKCLIN